MSHGSRTRKPPDAETGKQEAQAIGAFLHGLATRAETDPAFATQVGAALRESGLLTTSEQTAQVKPAETKRKGAKPKVSEETPSAKVEAAKDDAPDPFVLLRERGEAGLRATLDTCELATLRAIVRAHRLDPARISARWTARDRVIGLIVEQVRARINHGKAFTHV